MPTSAGVYGPRMAGAVERPDARARPADPRSGHVDPRQQATTLQALELVNGEMLTQLAVARRAADARRAAARAAEPASTGPWPAATPRRARSRSTSSRRRALWLVVRRHGSNVPERAAAGVGATPSSSARPARSPLAVADAGRRRGPPRRATGPLHGAGSSGGGIRVAQPVACWSTTSPAAASRASAASSASRTRAARSDRRSNPALRFFVFDAEPNMDRLLPPAPGAPLPPAPRARRPSTRPSIACSGTRSAAPPSPPNGGWREAPLRRSGAAGDGRRPTASPICSGRC